MTIIESKRRANAEIAELYSHTPPVPLTVKEG